MADPTNMTGEDDTSPSDDMKDYQGKEQDQGDGKNLTRPGTKPNDNTKGTSDSLCKLGAGQEFPCNYLHD